MKQNKKRSSSLVGQRSPVDADKEEEKQIWVELELSVKGTFGQNEAGLKESRE